MKSRPAALLGLLLVTVGLLSSACVGIQNPEGWAAPAPRGDSVLFFSRKDRLVSLKVDGESATRAWLFPDKDQPGQKDLKFKAAYDVSVVDGTAFFGSWEGGVFAVDAATGAPKWTLDKGIAGGIAGGPVVEGGRVVFGSTGGRLYVRNATDGRPVDGWPESGRKTDGAVWGRPVVSEGRVIVGTMDGNVSAFSLADGSLAWRYHADGAIPEVTLLGQDRLFVPAFDKSVAILDAATGAEVTRLKTGDWVWSGPAFREGIAYFGDLDGRMYALDIKSGVNGWADVHVDASVKSRPLFVGDVLVVATRDAEVHFLTLDGQSKNRVKLDGSGTVRAPLAPWEGKALVATTKGRLWVADTEKFAVREIAVVGGRP